MRDDDTRNGMRSEWGNDGAPMMPLPPLPEVSTFGLREPFAPLENAKRDTFSTGYQRDHSADKPGYEMLPPDALEELALLYTEGAKKYGRDNYRKGAPITRTCASMLRHAFKALRGDEDEGATERARLVRHFIATAWNALSAAQHLIDIDAGKLPAELDDR